MWWNVECCGMWCGMAYHVVVRLHLITYWMNCNVKSDDILFSCMSCHDLRWGWCVIYHFMWNFRPLFLKNFHMCWKIIVWWQFHVFDGCVLSDVLSDGIHVGCHVWCHDSSRGMSDHVMCDCIWLHVDCTYERCLMLCGMCYDVGLHVISCRKVCHVTWDVMSHRCGMGCHITILFSLLFDCVIALSWVFIRLCVWIMWLRKDNLLLSTWIDTILFVWLILLDYRKNCVVLFAYVMPMWFLLKKILGHLRAIW